MISSELRGWNYIVYTLIKNNFQAKVFTLNELYSYERYFELVYPSNFHIKAKLRQTVQNLRDKGVLVFLQKGKYQLLLKEERRESPSQLQEVVYLLTNNCMPGWVKIGRTNQIERRLKDLYNTSVPLPFIREDCIETRTEQDSRELERSIHNIIDTIDPDRRKNTEARKREFFKMTPEEAKNVFMLVRYINKVEIKETAMATY